MTKSATTTVSRVSALFLASALSAACAEDAGPLSPAAATVNGPVAAASGGRANINKQLAEVRQATAAFHSLDGAAAAGYGAQLTGCLALAGVGGQGFHYGKTSIIDGAVSLLEPELLMYEPRGGKLHLVGVEYVVPFDAWTSPEPPHLLGQHFHRNEAFGLWVLHAWIWKGNPDGMFADWNPSVRCGD